MQISLFDGTEKFKIDKPIRLISLFSGYDSQLFSLKYLGTNVESWRTCEWAVKSIQALKDAHYGDDNTDYSKDLKDDVVFEILHKLGISANYNEPMTFEQIKRLGIAKARQIYNNIRATHNMVNIQRVHAEDLGIKETDKYCYVMTYSFPCQDLSLAGKGAGMEKGSGTRSGMLWEVERILEECKELPQVLLMENVPEVIETNNIKHFAKWLEKLESLGYHCYWKVLNAKDYGVPQNRERCFMVSILGDYYYEFPQKEKELNHNWVDYKSSHYYFTQEDLIKIDNWKTFEKPLNDIKKQGDIIPTLVARGQISNASMVIFDDGKGKRNLSPKECFRLMGVRDEDYEKIAKNQSNASLYHLAGDSIVVDVLMAIFKQML